MVHARLTRDDHDDHGHDGELGADVEEVVHLPDEQIQADLHGRKHERHRRQDACLLRDDCPAHGKREEEFS